MDAAIITYVASTPTVAGSSIDYNKKAADLPNRSALPVWRGERIAVLIRLSLSTD